MQQLLLLVSGLRELALDPQTRRSALEACLAWLLARLAFLQDLLLSLEGFKRLLLFAYRRQHAEALAAALQTPPPGRSFDALDYFVDGQARQLLQFAALHALSAHLQADEALAPASLLPQVSRALLQTEEAKPGKMLEAVAAALASGMEARLLLVDAMLLASLAAATFGSPPEAYLSAFGGASGPLPSRTAARLELAWLALRGALFELQRPTVVYIRNVEGLLCGSWEAHNAFLAAFGSPEALSLEGAAPAAPLVLLGGVSVAESAAALAGVRPQREMQPGFGGSEEDEDGDGGLRPKSSGSRGGGLFGSGGGGLEGLDDELGLSDLLISLSRLAGEGNQRPNSRRLLRKVFPTAVRLQPPPAGPAAVRHLQRMEADAAQEAEDENFRSAKAVAVSTGVALPPRESGIYAAPGGKALSREAWGKVLSWAVSMQTLKRVQDEQQREQEEEASVRQLAEARAAIEGSELPEHGAPEAKEGPAGSPEPRTPPRTGLRRRRGDGSGSDSPAVPGALQRQQAALAGYAVSAWQVLSPLSVARAAARLPGQALRASRTAARWGAARLPLVGGWLEGVLEERLDARQVEAELQELEEQLAALERASDAADARADACAAGSTAGSGGGSGVLALSELAVQYGLGMLQRSSGSAKQAIEPSNSYERALLAEVLSPEACGRGFCEVGALSEAKTALREAVQLPLKHPELFAGGTLARPSKGVLLFGPPGTGKTLVARAAAAECGAAFLAISPSAVASKWFGDSTKLIRAAFSLAAKLSPCVIFIDEVDALLGKRNSSREHEALREMKNELMAQWDGIRPGTARIMVLGATNRPFDLDEAVLRRFTSRLFIGLPDRPARAQILEVVLGGERLGPDVDLQRLAERTDGYSGADLRQLCVQAAMRPVRALLEAESAAGAAAVPAAAEEAPGPAGAAADGEASSADAASKPLVGTEASSPAGSSAGLASEGAGAASTASAPVELALVPARLSIDSGGGSGGSGAGVRLVPRLSTLLRQAEGVARAPRNPKTDLRPIGMRDFEEALKEVGPSVDPDSSTIAELNTWNRTFGTSVDKGGVAGHRLSYYT